MIPAGICILKMTPARSTVPEAGKTRMARVAFSPADYLGLSFGILVGLVESVAPAESASERMAELAV